LHKQKSAPVKGQTLFCGTTFVDLQKTQVTPYEGAITPPANNAGLRPGYWALLPFPSPSAGHLPYRLPQGFHHPPLSVGAHHGLISASKVSFVILL